MLKKLAILRNDSIRPCPYGLSVKNACQNVGEAIHMMQPLDTVPGSKRKELKKKNIRVYALHAEKTACPFADTIIDGKDFVHCDFLEGGQMQKSFPFPVTPYYPRVFNGLGSYQFLSYPLDSYVNNYDARNTFSGIFSLYASTGEVLLNKRGSLPDPILIDLIDKLIIK